MSCSAGLIGSETWSRVLEYGFGSSRIELPVIGTQASVDWSVFSRLGLKAAYARFPVGFDDDFACSSADIAPMLDALRLSGVDLARFSDIGERRVLGGRTLKSTNLFETRIDSLSDWSEKGLSRAVRRKIEKSRAAGVSVRSARPEDSAKIFEIYRETISRQRGSVRYTSRYFEALCGLCVEDRRLSVGVAITVSGVPCGFIVVAHSDASSHYLHGGYLSSASRLRPGYVSMEWAIKRSRDYGSQHFNMLTSPPGQPTLVSFKESFGGKSYVRKHYEVPTSPAGVIVHAGLHAMRRANRELD